MPRRHDERVFRRRRSAAQLRDQIAEEFLRLKLPAIFIDALERAVRAG